MVWRKQTSLWSKKIADPESVIRDRGVDTPQGGRQLTLLSGVKQATALKSLANIGSSKH